MVRYADLGFESVDAYFDYFMANLLTTNKTYEYFVDWGKVRKNARRYKRELALLNSLRKSSLGKIGDELKELLTDYPETAKAIPMLIAERLHKGTISIFDKDLDRILEFDFNKKEYSNDELDRIVLFCKKTGIFDLITKEVKDLEDYLLGVEVGIDTNGRKGRSGKIFENMIYDLLKSNLTKEYSINYQDNNFSLYTTKSGHELNRHDFVIYKKGKPLSVIEVNFYNVQGSKPDSIVGNYINMNKRAEEKGVQFIWITDGIGWIHMKGYIRKAIEEIPWVLNYKLTKKKITEVVGKIS